MQGGTNPTQVSLVLDPRSIDALVERINIAFTEAFTKANKVASAQMAQMSKDVTDSVKHITTAVNNSESAFVNLGKKGKVALHPMSQEALALVDALQAVAKSSGEVIAAVQKSSVQQRRASVETTNQLDNAARLEIANVRNVGIQTNIEGQKAVVVARGAAKSRVLITQGMVRSIILLEKGIGATISGVAKTAVSSVSKIFGGLTGLFKKDTTGISAQLRETNAAIARGVKQGNTELTTGVRGSLSKREELLRSSFRTQESIVRGSALRQQETLAGLRKGTQTGVLGAANRGLNIGSLIGGFAVIQAARSTFKVGSEFVRGLAVLQAQLGLTEEQMKGVDALSVQLGNDISLPGVSALDAAQAIQILSKQFGSLGDGAIVAAENAAKGTLQLSRAVGASAEDTAGIIGAAVNVFGISADKAITVADAVAGAMTQAAGVSFEDFKTAFIQGATVFENFVGPAESANDVLLDFNTSLAVLAKSGLVGESAGAGLKQFFLSASKQSDKALALQDDLAKRAGTTGRIFFDAAHKARPFAESLDLLRKSLRGMSDEQRTATLTTLFGVRAQTIATALIRESGDDYDAIRERISKQGLAAKIAAAQNTGFAGALDALKSVVETLQIQLFKKLNPALGVVTLGIATLANNIFSGTGAFAILRRALLGVAIGMGAIIAAKGAVEVIKLLGVAAKLALTPFGAVLVAAGLLGAAISILADRSEPFRKALGDLVDRLKGLGTAALGLVSKGLSALGGVIERDVMPFLITMVNFLSDHVVGAFDAVSRFITDKAIPAIKSAAEFIGKIASIGFRAVVDFIHDHAIPAFKAFADFVVTTVVPVAIHVGEIFKGAFDTALEAVKGFWHTVEPILRPALEGFKTLGRAIAAIFTGGDFSQLGKGFSAVGSGISTSFSTIGKNLLGVLDRLWETLQAWFREHFTGAKLIDLGKGFLDLVEFIGHTIGTIVTSPTFIRAVALVAAGLAAAAALIAIRFVEGFGKAFADHFDELLALLGKTVLAGFVAIFENPLIAVAIGLAIFGIFRLVNLAKGFRAAGVSAGGGFTGGFKAGIQSLKNQGNVLTSFFGGPERVARTYAQGVTKAFSKEMTGLQTKLRALGSKTVVAGGTGLPGFIGPTNTAQARAELRLLSKGIDNATLRGLIMRDSFKKVGTGISSTFKGLATGIPNVIKGVVKGVGAALNATNVYTGPGTSGAKAFATAFRDSVRGSGKLIASGFAGIGAAISATAAAQGKSAGAVLGGALAKAAIGAVAAFATFQGGKAEGASGGSGLLSALIGGISAGAIIGGPFGVAVGAITVGAGLIGAAMGRAEARTKAFRAEVDRLSTTFTENLDKALKDGKIDLDNLDFKTAINIGSSKEDFTKALADALTPDQRALVRSLGLSVDQVFKILEDSGGDVDVFTKKFQDAFITITQDSDDFRNKIGPKADVISDILRKILEPGGDASISDFLAHTDVNEGIFNAIQANKGLLDSILKTAAGFTTEAGAIAQTIKQSEDYKAITETLPTTSPFATINTLESIVNIANLGKAARQARTDAVKLFLANVTIGDSAEEANAKLEKLHLPTIPQDIIDTWNRQLDDVGKDIEGLQKILDDTPQAIADQIIRAITPSVGSLRGAVDDALNGAATVGSLRGAVDQTIVDDEGIASAIQAALAKGGVNGTAELNQQLQAAALNLGNIITLGVTSHAIVTTDDAKALLEPIRQGFIDSLDPESPGFQAAVDQINVLFDGTVKDLQPTIDLIKATQAAEDFHKQVQLFLTEHPFATTFAAEFATAIATHPGLTFPGGPNPGGQSVSPGSTLLDSLLPTQDEIAAAGKKAGDAMGPAGVQTAAGYAAGIHSQESKRIVAAAVKDLTDSAVKNANTNLKIKSPSQVFHEIGGFMTQGFADGITAGASAAATAASAAAQAAVDAAKGVINGNPLQLDLQSAQGHDKGGRNKDQHINEIAGQFIPSPVPIGVGQASWPEIARQIFGPQGVRGVGAGLADQGPSDIELGALKASREELDSLIALARGLVTTAEQMNKRGPDVTNVSIVEAKDARSTARATIAELRADRMLLKGVR